MTSLKIPQNLYRYYFKLFCHLTETWLKILHSGELKLIFVGNQPQNVQEKIVSLLFTCVHVTLSSLP